MYVANNSRSIHLGESSDNTSTDKEEFWSSYEELMVKNSVCFAKLVICCQIWVGYSLNQTEMVHCVVLSMQLAQS
jgi:hypothetical protein